MFVLQKLSPTLSSSFYEEDLSDQIYYSEDEDDVLPGDTVTHAKPLAENSSDPSQVHQDHATSLLSQLTNGNLPSQATIELAIAQLMESLTAEEKPLMSQLVQQMAVMNPVLVATSPMALQVEAIRIILTTRGQRALAMGVPAIQQMANQAQLQSLPQISPVATAATQPTSMMAATESHPVSVHHNGQQDLPSQLQASGLRHHHLPVPRSRESTMPDTDAKYPEDGSSTSSGHAQLGAGPALGRGRGRGVSSTGRQHDDEMCQQDLPRGRGAGRGKPRNSAAGEANSLLGNSSAPVCQPLIPPVSHTAPPVQQNESDGQRAVNSSENWEEEIDEFGSEVFHVKSSFFRSGTR